METHKKISGPSNLVRVPASQPTQSHDGLRPLTWDGTVNTRDWIVLYEM